MVEREFGVVESTLQAIQQLAERKFEAIEGEFGVVETAQQITQQNLQGKIGEVQMIAQANQHLMIA